MLLKPLRRWLNGREIFIPGDRVIMRRFVVFDSDFLGLYVHQICARDHEALHNHPWRWSAALVLSGWYSEERATESGSTEMRIARAGSVNFFSQKTFHRIDRVADQSAWTLYVHGRRAQRDGFLIKGENGWTYRDAADVNLEATRPTTLS
jgi:hypothetical protein